MAARFVGAPALPILNIWRGTLTALRPHGPRHHRIGWHRLAWPWRGALKRQVDAIAGQFEQVGKVVGARDGFFSLRAEPGAAA